MATKRNLLPSTTPSHDNPLSRHTLSYLNGGGGSSKTMRANELFRQKEPLSSHMLSYLNGGGGSSKTM
ncbi:MAG: hypothetical protein AB2556_23230 [Candidatus Thiodiazotropha sp.]